MGRGKRESQGTLPNKVEIFKQVLRYKKMNKILRDKTKMIIKGKVTGFIPAGQKSLDCYQNM